MVRAEPGRRIAMPALVSPLGVHMAWVIASALGAAILILGLYVTFATRYTATAQIAFDARRSAVQAAQIDDYLFAPDRIATIADRLHLVAPGGDDWLPARVGALARQRAVERLRKGFRVEQTDLTNVFLLRYSDGARRRVAPIADAFAAAIVRADALPPGGHARLIARATDPTAPDGSLILPIALVALGAAAAAGTALTLCETLQKGPRSPAAAEKALGLPVVAMIPAVRDVAAGARAALTEMPVTAPQSDYARGFRRLLAAHPSGRIIAVCSALAGEGKSTFAISLARTAALAGRRVALIDCDGRIRAASAALDVVGRPGLVQVMDEALPLDDALIADPRSPLMILAHSRDAAVKSFWSREAMAGLREVTQALARSFDLVVIDTPPLLALVEARDIASVADEALLIARWRRTPFGALRHARDILAAKSVRASLVLSFVRLAAPDREPIVPSAQRRRRPGHQLVLS
ncbi:CpsD/CapB family tyrosine-protein kinase [Sphingomonas sp. BIUV-7]|uniref:non-specific protein-tyrosine kinase n=1 Tax=Sphingomonas natans TaxID=3063330 RepID=A0ABT8YB33_9SPHN|nr:CpsD/CapB family tyrosine-protein kinase [Sphingomonas sp. BIUV-7]MDO6415546.1 CpsD/CapB family tyrosine-protein kinase [Sphingomonas sp. BIUV-7]